MIVNLMHVSIIIIIFARTKGITETFLWESAHRKEELLAGVREEYVILVWKPRHVDGEWRQSCFIVEIILSRN